MDKILKNLFFFLLFWNLLAVQLEAGPLKVRIFSHQNGHGLETDWKILSKALEELGVEVGCRYWWDPIENSPPVDINIFFEHLNPDWFPHASLNCFVPNPEWYYQGPEFLKGIDTILCRTKEVERIFQELGKHTYFLGFTSPDCCQPEIIKDFSSIVHLAGGSIQKGTSIILDVWLRHPSFPLLAMIHRFCTYAPERSNLLWLTYWVDECTLRYYQNSCGIHLCPSETEGFGHYIMEAMSTGAVIVTTDAPPMNEFITDPRCLVPYDRTDVKNLGINYYVSADGLASTVKHLMSLPEEELREIGLRNRAAYLSKTKEFKENLKKFIFQIVEEKEKVNMNQLLINDY